MRHQLHGSSQATPTLWSGTSHKAPTKQVYASVATLLLQKNTRFHHK